MTNRFFTILLLFVTAIYSVRADEGMWLPYLMSNSTIEKMQTKGLTIPYDSIFNTGKPSLKDAVAALDGGSCTAEFVSAKGLLLTNHHCGYSEIQDHSTLEHDYLKDGFWARTQEEELPNPGKTATILIDAKNMTNRFLAVLSDTLSEPQRVILVDSLTAVIVDSVENATGYEASVKPFFSGNLYILFITETFKDVRLVGAPPSDIGKFGGDTDNWVWPRHTGDFSIFRVYCSPDGKPAEYSPDNVPFKPKKFLKISLEGISENDFSMIMGYPGSTERYIPSYGIRQIENYVNPVIIEVRGIKQDIWKKAMLKNPKVRIQYAAKFSESSNYWKYSIGQNEGLRHMNVIEKREEFEARFTDWVNSDSLRKQKYGKTLPLLDATYMLTNDITKAATIAEETVLAGPDMPMFVINVMFKLYDILITSDDEDIINDLNKMSKKFYKDFNGELDKKVFVAMLEYYMNNIEEKFRAGESELLPKKFKGDYAKFADYLYERSLFRSEESFNEILAKKDLDKISDDPFYTFVSTTLSSYYELASLIDQFDTEREKSMRRYLSGQFSMLPVKDFYPDANSTLRLTYGQVGDYIPKDGVIYEYRTTLKGIMEKEDPSNPDFIVPEKLKELYNEKDYGRYAGKDGKMPVCFITNNDITGGNSGSPVMDKNGNLIGIAFDGNWEAMTGDLAFDNNVQKTICVDIRYVLFVIDKYAGAGNLIKEMTTTSAPSNSTKKGA